MSYTIADLIGAGGFINHGSGTVTIHIDDLVDADGNSFLPFYPYMGITGCEQFLAAYFAYLNYRTRQRPATIDNKPSSESTQQISVDAIDTIGELDPKQAIVAQPIPIGNGVTQEIRNGITQTRFDFWFSVYLQNVIQYDPGNTV